MSGLNLGKLLAEAGVKGGKPASRPPTLEELRALSRKTEPEEFSKQAMDRLGSAFSGLKDPAKVKDGKEFMKELNAIFNQSHDNHIGGDVVTLHTIIAVCQLVHWHRDRKDISPSRKKSFNKIIPWLLERRDKIEKKPPKDICAYMQECLYARDDINFWS